MIARESEKNDIAVSIIVPAYNAEKTLAMTIDSLLAQTLANIEIIIVNDGSTDSTGDIIRNYESQNPDRIVGIYQENAGVSAARNAGLDIAKGEYVGFADADDWVSPEMFMQMFQCACEKDADLMQCWRYDVVGEKEIVRRPKKGCTGASIYDNPKIISSQTLFVWDKIFRSEIIKRNNIRFKYRYAEDFLFLIKFEANSKNIEELQLPLYYYQVQREGAVTSKTNEAMLDMPKSFAEANDFILDEGYYNELVGELWKVESHCYLRRLNGFWTCKDKQLQENIAKSFFDLFNQYFYNWENTIRFVGISKRIEHRFNAYRSDWNKMIKFIYYPEIPKRICRKTVFLIVKLSKWKDKQIKNIKKLKAKFIQTKNKIKQRRTSMIYANYLKKPIEKNTVLLTSYFGSSFSDSIYYLFLDLIKRKDIKIYIGTNSMKRETVFLKYNKLPLTLVSINSDDYLKVLSTAEYLICNSRFPSLFSKREGQIYLNTWHGTPLKTLGKDMNTGLKDIGNNQTNFLMCDYLLYPNRYTKDAIMSSFFLDDLYSGQVILGGYPRNAVFFDTQDAKALRSKLRLDDKRVFIYMPTWRGSTVGSAEVRDYADELNEMLEYLDDLLEDDIIVYVKLHQVVMRKIKLQRFKHFRLPHPLYENYRFVNIVDGLITDYSSVFFDFANTKKDIILFTYDYDRYMEERGTYFDMETLPFLRINDREKLAEYLNSWNGFTPNAEYMEFCEKYCKYDNKNAPFHVNNAILSNNFSEEIEVISYEDNSKRSYHIHFMSNLKDAEQVTEFEEMANTVASDDLFVFAQWSFCKSTEELLIKYANSGIRYIVTPGDMPATMSEILCLFLYRKFRLFKKAARKLYSKELKRILPGINILKISNHSNDLKFKDITTSMQI